MKALLISPKGAERNQQQDIIYDIYQSLEGTLALMTDDIEFIPNLALLTLAAYFDPSWEITFIEEDYIDDAESNYILHEAPYDLACISIVNYNALRGYEIAQTLRKRGVYTVIGGLHASALPHEATKYADTVIIGEGEEVFQQFLYDFQKGEPSPIYRCTKPVDLTLIPPARYDLIKNITRFNKMPVFATRGCPHRCNFCIFPQVYARVYRHKKVEQVIKDIENIKKIHPKPYIHFCDENLLANKKFSHQLVKALIDLDVKWECFCDIGIAQDDYLLDLLQKSKCQDLLIGFESIDPKVMEKIDPWKTKTLKKYEEYIHKIQSKGIPITGLFILGFDGDDKRVFEKTRNFIAKVKLFDMDFAILTPIPGTPLYYRLKKEGRIISENWNKYTWTHVNFQPMNMNAIQLQKGLLWLFKEFASSDMLSKRETHKHTSRMTSF